MSRPIGSSCCDNTVTSKQGEIDVYLCDDCGRECEVIL